MQIRTMKQFKEHVNKDGGAEVVIRLKGGLISRKHVSYDGELFYVHNYIDESRQTLTEKELMDGGHTNIGFAMKRGVLISDS